MTTVAFPNGTAKNNNYCTFVKFFPYLLCYPSDPLLVALAM